MKTITFICLFALVSYCTNSFSKSKGDSSHDVFATGILAFGEGENTRLLAWTRDGKLKFLNLSFDEQKTLNLKGNYINAITPYPSGFLVLTTVETKNGGTNTFIIDVNEKGEIQNRWQSANRESVFQFYSAAFDGGKRLATTQGFMDNPNELLELLPNGQIKTMEKFPNKVFVLPVSNGAPIICGEPNLTMQYSSVAYCKRESETPWKIEDTWEKTPPILCNNYLIEETGKFSRKNNVKDAEKIAVRELLKGEEVNSRPIPAYGSAGGFRFLRCSENKVVIGTSDKLIVASVPDLKNVGTVDCGIPEPRDAILIGDTAYCINGKGKLVKKSLKPQ